MNVLSTLSSLGSNYSMIILLVVFAAVFYFFIIRPENKKKKEAEALRNSIKIGDKITTIGGIVGKVCDIKDDKIVIESSADRVRMELQKWSVMTNNTAEEDKVKAQAEARQKAKDRAAERAKAKEDRAKEKAKEKKKQ